VKVLIVDNYDSFTYNLVHLVEQFVAEVTVLRNDKIDLQEVEQFDKILLSPGPGLPKEAGLLNELIKKYAPTKSIFGVCLGHQAIGEMFGCKLLNIKKVKHGEESILTQVDSSELLFKGIEEPITVGHYHSWVIDENSLDENWKVTAFSDGLVMAIAHQRWDVRGLQFHPESVMTSQGSKMIQNWLNS
jgi:anthranilate synthase component II